MAVRPHLLPRLRSPAVVFGPRFSSGTIIRRWRPDSTPIASYTIDISGHGLKALQHIDACAYFDDRLIRFKGLKIPGGRTEEWTLPGWTGSRGDILRALAAVVQERHRESVSLAFESRVTSVNVDAGTLTYVSKSGDTQTRRFDFIVGGDGAGSVVRKAMREHAIRVDASNACGNSASTVAQTVVIP